MSIWPRHASDTDPWVGRFASAARIFAWMSMGGTSGDTNSSSYYLSYQAAARAVNRSGGRRVHLLRPSPRKHWPANSAVLEGLAQEVEDIANGLRDEADDANKVLAEGTYDSQDIDAAERELRTAAEALAGSPLTGPLPTRTDSGPITIAFAIIQDSAGDYIIHNGFAYKLSAGEPYELICCEVEDSRPVWSESGAVDFPRVDDDQRPLLEQIRETLRRHAAAENQQ